tara:strand:+ start:273 stop:569 length:297 start_codon:yes stop_codon:yes gene_type:complete
MNNDFKKGLSISLRILAALLIPIEIYFISSNFSIRNEAKEEYEEYVKLCSEAHLRNYEKGDGILIMMNVDDANKESFSKKWCKKYDGTFWKCWKQRNK